MNEREETFIPALPMAARLAEMWGGADGFPLSVKEGRAFLESEREIAGCVSAKGGGTFGTGNGCGAGYMVPV